MKNREIAGLFDDIADALEIRGESGFKVVAYRKAARTLQDMTEDIETVAREGRLRAIPGVGSGLAEKIGEYLKTGKIAKYHEVMAGIPESLLDLLKIQGLGGKTIHLMHEKLGVRNLADLKRVIEDGSLADLYGMGARKVDNIRTGIKAREHVVERISIYEASLIADDIIAYFKNSPLVGRVSPAGSLRRMKETVGDIDILATGRKGAEIISGFTRYPRTSRILAEGGTKGSIVVRTDTAERQVDLRIVDESAYGTALIYFTGSKAHNIKLRGMAKNRGLKISEYGVFKGSRRIAGREEEDVYRVLGMTWIPPEMREDAGEVEAALENRLPALVSCDDIRGDLHVHSDWSDGTVTIAGLAEIARGLGFEYIALCDHSESAYYARGLTPERLKRRCREIEDLNKRWKGFRVLKGIEADILADGTLDCPESLLAKLDFVVGAVHSGFKKNVTERMLKALENPYLSTIAHPSGRLISRREGYEVDLGAVLKGAARTGKAMELNAYFDRLDLNEFYLKEARKLGVKISIGTDTHGADGMQMMRFGVGIARRAWLEKGDVLNSLSVDELLARRSLKGAAGERPRRKH
jgi:DNA polymerase (family 10)